LELLGILPGEDRSESTGAYSLTAGRRVLCSGRRGVAGWTEVNRWTETRCSRTWRDESCGTEREPWKGRVSRLGLVRILWTFSCQRFIALFEERELHFYFFSAGQLE
ncbi:hypothetical protein GOODEAATRI_021516, partial [Goodea atripinnis]